MKTREKTKSHVVMLVTNHEDDVYCFRKELLEALFKQGYSLIISCPYGEKLRLLEDIEYKYDEVKIDRRGTNVFNDLRLYLHYQKVMRQSHPDVVLCYTIKPNIYASISAALLHIPYLNNVTGLGSVLSKGKVFKSFILFLLKIAFLKSSCVFFQNSENMELALDKKIISGCYRVIPGSGVNTERFYLQPYPDDKIIVFNYIGRMLKEKGVDDYIDAAKIIKQRYQNTEFNIIGFIEPSERHYQKYIEELSEKGIITYRGNQSDIRPYIARSHAIIHPSVYGEGISNVLLESAASGRPLITTDKAGCRETVEDGVTGYIYHGGSVDQLVDAIDRFIKLENVEREEMGIRGREKVKREFERKKVVEAYQDCISGLF